MNYSLRISAKFSALPKNKFNFDQHLSLLGADFFGEDFALSAGGFFEGAFFFGDPSMKNWKVLVG